MSTLSFIPHADNQKTSPILYIFHPQVAVVVQQKQYLVELLHSVLIQIDHCTVAPSGIHSNEQSKGEANGHQIILLRDKVYLFEMLSVVHAFSFNLPGNKDFVFIAAPKPHCK
jgi:hypothetical protein